MKSKIDLENGIAPLSEFRQDAKKFLSRLKKSNQPLILTQNGRSAAVVLSPEEYQRMEYEKELYKAIAEGEKDVVEGRTFKHEDVFKEYLE